MSKSKMIVRTKFIDRACHWTVVICFFLVALSGISFFFPTLQWLTETFGTPQMGRILHPFFGLLIFVALMFMFVRFVHHNIPDKKDIPWLKNIVEVLKGNEHKVADVGKYNAGQKILFWGIMGLISVLLVSGVVIWWKRRPQGGLGVPPLRHDLPTWKAGVAIMLALAIAFPLVGASLIAVWGLDRLWLMVRKLRPDERLS